VISLWSQLKDRVNKSSVACFLLLCIVLGPSLAMSDEHAVDRPSLPTREGDVQQVIHDYILAHPEVLIESLQSAKRKAEEEFAAATKSITAAYKKELIEDPRAPVFGNPEGDVTVVEFFDYRCPYCRQVDPWLRALVSSDPGIRIVQKELPILGPPSVFAARVALAANKQGKHLELHEALMAKKPNFDEAGILGVAEAVGLDLVRLKADMNSAEVDAEILSGARVAKALRLTGTPAFVVGSELVPGATDLETLKALVNEARREPK
jgi:protein-disulfide isomerase